MATPQVVFRGSASVEGTAGTFAAVITAGVFNINKTAKLTQNFEEEIIKDNHGYDIAWLYRNQHAMLDVELLWMGATAAEIIAPLTADGTNAPLSSLGYPFLAPGSWVTMSGFLLTGFNGVFQLQSGWEVSQTQSGIATYTCKLKKYSNADQVAALKVIPIADPAVN